MDEQAIREEVARRAVELGGPTDPRDVTLEFMEAEAAPGCRLFHARWGAGERENSLSGLVMDAEPPDTYPGQALAKIFRRWIETEGSLPDARHAAKVSAYVFNPAGRREVILSEEDRSRLIERSEWLPHVRLPALIELGGQPGVAFWWIGRRGASEMRFYFDEAGRIRIGEKSIRDFLQGEVAESSA
ncbi:MAG: hypothetical protein H0T60_13610 [Acidobacteria bacterium]|nr:hypothetical protein [Acidobacteriota bacterium]